MKLKNYVLSFCLVLLITTVSTMMTLRGQGQDKPASDKQTQVGKRQISVEDYPIADYTEQEPTGAQARSLRRARSGRHGITDKSIKDLNNFILREDSEPVEISQPSDHAPLEPAIPAAQSSVIIVGEITDAQAYLSSDKTGVYSEFTTAVSEVLKSSTFLPFSVGDSIIAERSGGRVRLPSGKVLLRGFSHKSMPRVGRQYVLFLKYNDQGQDFSIITGYELRAGKVFPLDGVPKDDYRLAQFAVYEGADAAAFLSEVRAAIEGAPQTSPNGGQERGSNVASDSTLWDSLSLQAAVYWS